MAVLPMGGDIFQIVWSAPLSTCIKRSELNNSAFLDLLATVLPYKMEPDVLLDKPSFFPLQ